MTEEHCDTHIRTPLLLLKTKSTPNDGYEELFLATSAPRFDPIFVPVLEHKILDDGLQTVRELLQQKKFGRELGRTYGGLIFTSQRAVEAFALLVEEGQSGTMMAGHICKISRYIRLGLRRLEHYGPIRGIPPLNICGAQCGNGEALAHYMLNHYGERYKDFEVKPPVLFLVGEQRRDIIPRTLMNSSLPDKQRIKVDEVIIYGTAEMESFEQDFSTILHKTSDRMPRWVVVFSPTGCEAMLRALNLLDPTTRQVPLGDHTQNNRNGTYVATIGPTTRDYLMENFGFCPDVCAEKPSPEGVEKSVRRFLVGRPETTPSNELDAPNEFSLRIS